MSLTDIVNDVLDERLRDPLGLPEEFRGWVPEWVGTVGITVPRANVVGAYTTADTVGELGEAVHGRPCMLRVGTSAPYDFVQMTFDEVANLWVSTQVWTSYQTRHAQASSSSYVDLTHLGGGGSTPQMSPSAVTNLVGKSNAGLRPQVILTGALTSNGSDLKYSRVSIQQYNSGDTSLTEVGTGAEISSSSASTVYVASDWSDITLSGVSENYGFILISIKHSGTSTTDSHRAHVVTFRWVADPA